MKFLTRFFFVVSFFLAITFLTSMLSRSHLHMRMKFAFFFRHFFLIVFFSAIVCKASFLINFKILQTGFNRLREVDLVMISSRRRLWCCFNSIFLKINSTMIFRVFFTKVFSFFSRMKLFYSVRFWILIFHTISPRFIFWSIWGFMRDKISEEDKNNNEQKISKFDWKTNFLNWITHLIESMGHMPDFWKADLIVDFLKMLSRILIKSWQKRLIEYAISNSEIVFWITTSCQCLYGWKTATSKNCIQCVIWNISG